MLKNSKHHLSNIQPGTYPWTDPTEQDLEADDFNKIWECIKSWNINVPEVYEGYSNATGNHVIAILIALGLRGKPSTDTRKYDIETGQFSEPLTYERVKYPAPNKT